MAVTKFHDLPMAGAEKPRAHLSDAVEQALAGGQLYEHVLQKIARLRLIPGQVEQEGEERRGMEVENFPEFAGHVCGRTHRPAPFVYPRE